MLAMDSSNSSTIRLSAMMFLQFFIWGAWYVSMTGWMGVEKISGLIAWAYTVGPIAAIISPIFLGLIADRYFATQKVLGVMHLLGGAALLAVPSVVRAANQPVPTAADADFFHPYILLLLAHMLCYMPTLGLTNTLCFHHMSSPEKQFPVVRVFGTIGWIVGNIVVGGNLKTFGLSTTWIAEGDKSPVQFLIAGSAAIALGLFAFSLPHTPPPAAGRKSSIAQVLGLESLRLLGKPNYAVFAVCSFLICIPLAGYYAYARNYVEFTGFKNPTLTMSAGQMSEVVFMLLMPLCFARMGVKWMLAVGMLAWVVRYGLFAGAAADRTMWMVLGGVLLHGICYDFFFVAGSIYVDRTAPKEIRGQAQGFLIVLTQGLGLGIGAQAFGRLVAWHTPTAPEGAPLDWQSIWIAPCAIAGFIFLLFIALFRSPKTNTA